MFELKGIITAMVTPMNDNQEIDEEATRKMVRMLIDKGIHGLFIIGTNGEFHLLTEEEKVQFAKIVIDEANHEIPIYVGTGGNSTREVIKLTKRIKELGADAVSVITPYYLPPSQADLVEHYKAIAEAVDIPIILYNIPGNTGINIEPDSVRELAKIPNIIGVKDSSGNIDNIKAYLDVTKDSDFVVLSGSDSLILKSLKIGTVGAIAATSNVLPEIDVDIYNSFINGDIERAEKAQESINPLRMVLKKGVAPSIMKKMLNLVGYKAGQPRLPIREPNEEIIEEIKEIIEHYHIQYEA